MLIVKAHLVNGDLMEFREGDDFMRKLRVLQAQGLEGKALIHRLITDDWSPPPTVVHIKGQLSSGELVDLRIPYR